MTIKEQRQLLIDLFAEAGPSHHQAYIETDGDDPEWPLWYAKYVQPKIDTILGQPFTQSELVYLILSAEYEREREAPEAAWPEYYADYFLARHGTRTP